MLAIAAIAALSTLGLMYDVISPDMLPGAKCTRGCANWSSIQNATIMSWWAHGAPPAEAGAFCAQMARSPGLNSKPAHCLHNPGGVNGSGCFCEGSMEWDDCVSRLNTPEQINVQIAAPDTVVLAFVTFEKVAPTAPPEALVGRVSGALKPVHAGAGAVTHTYLTSDGSRKYYMHFVTLRGLEPRGTYYYMVRSGGSAHQEEGKGWSREHNFRAGYVGGDGGETSIGIFGDMVRAIPLLLQLLPCAAFSIAVRLTIVHAGDLWLECPRQPPRRRRGEDDRPRRPHGECNPVALAPVRCFLGRCGTLSGCAPGNIARRATTHMTWALATRDAATATWWHLRR